MTQPEARRLFLFDSSVLFLGSISDPDRHAHHAIQFAVAVDDELSLRSDDDRHTCRAALVPSNRLWLRLRRAVELLASAGSLTEAAHDAGFSDSAHLSRTFRKMFGVKPSLLLAARSFIHVERGF